MSYESKKPRGRKEQLGRQATHRAGMNRFYVGATHIADAIHENKNDEWTRRSLEEATRHAEQILREDPDRECCHIVEVVRVVRRSPGVVVEDLR